MPAGQVCVWALLAFFVLVTLVGNGHSALPPTGAFQSEANQLEVKYLPQLKRLFAKKCDKAAHSFGSMVPEDFNSTRAYLDVELAAGRLLDCAKSVANVTQIVEEMELARPTGDLDVVFGKYCARLPQVEKCLADFNAALVPCLTAAERVTNAVQMRILNKILSGFICYRNGDHIALFLAEQGPECLESQKDNISNCMNATFSAYLPKQTSLAIEEITELPEMVIGPKQCIDIHNFEECVLGYLEQCNNITPSNIIESMFRYVRKETKCQPEIDRTLEERKALKMIREGRNGQARIMGLWLMVTVSTLFTIRRSF